MKYNCILFDLDGTLTNPAEGIINSVIYALNKMGAAIPCRQELYEFIGPPLHDSFAGLPGFSDTEADRAIMYYREYYREKGIMENALIVGIDRLLRTLSEKGAVLAVATSKPEPFAKQILVSYGVAGYFTCIMGSNLDGTGTRKSDVIRRALSLCGQSGALNAVMIGDRKYDIIGAKEAGIASIGVLFGYGSRKELEDAGTNQIAETVDELGNLLL